MKHKITIQDIEKPNNNKINEDIKWICNSFDFVNGRDIESISSKIMCEILNQLKSHSLVPPEIIARSLNVETPRVNHHLRNLMESGIIIQEKRKIILSGRNLSDSIEEMKRESDKLFDRILEVSKKIDEAIDFK